MWILCEIPRMISWNVFLLVSNTAQKDWISRRSRTWKVLLVLCSARVRGPFTLLLSFGLKKGVEVGLDP